MECWFMNIEAVLYSLLEIEFNQMSRYLEILPSLLNSYKQELVDAVEQKAEELDEDSKHDFYESYQDDFAELEEVFPGFLLNGFIVTWYSFVEQQLIELCDARKLTIAVSIRDRDRLDDGIKRAYKFLSKAANYRIENGAWQELQIIGWLRNHIAHSGDKWVPHSRKKPSGESVEVKEKDPLTMEEYTVYVKVDKETLRYLQKHSLISDRFLLTPSVEYCEYLVRFGKGFFKKIYKDIGVIP
jgi:hypothetical protein